MDRRAFFIKAGRGIIGATLLAGTGFLLTRPNTGDDCGFDFVCKNCKKIGKCSLPQANDYKLKKKETTKK